MQANLKTLRDQIEASLAERDFAVFRGLANPFDKSSVVFWDTDATQDYNAYLDVASKLGIKLITLNAREFDSQTVTDAIERLSESSIPFEDRRTMERDLKKMKSYHGFTCHVEMTFDYQNRVYIFMCRADWFNTLMEQLDELEELTMDFDDDDEDEGPEPMGGYFSRN